MKRVKGIKEREVNWSTFKRYFKKKFLSEQYYEERAKEFYELKLGSMTMKDLNSKFLSLLRYVPYLVDEKPKVIRDNLRSKMGLLRDVLQKYKIY